MTSLLITGGAGFIGSHTCLVLLGAGHDLVVLDNFSNSSPESLRRVMELAGPGADGRLTVVEGDIRNPADLERAFAAAPANRPIEAVIHFAGLKAVGESVQHPLRYWDVNLSGSRQLLSAMQAQGCRTLVFSSSATLYGIPEQVPIPETAPIQPINPYGHSKAAVEQLLADLSASEPGWRIARLRYFNPVGAHPSGLIGEDPSGIPNNLFPFVSQVAVGRRERLQVFGGDWPTRDGSGVRDYIHVMDLAEGHKAALDTLLAETPQMLTLNLGSGQGHSVLEVVAAFERASGRAVPYELVERRPGDAASTVADPALALKRLGWRTRRSLAEMCRDGWAWQSVNPNGYSTATIQGGELMPKTVLITGAAGGIGSGLVAALASAGWAVIGSDHPAAGPDPSTLQHCQGWITADLAALSRHPDHLEAFKSAVLTATAGHDFMAIVHNAALQRLGSFEQLTAMDWCETLEVNLMAPVAISRALLPQLQRQCGSIVHIGSIHSQLTKPGFTAYATSKAALAGLTRAMAVELGGSVRVNAIEPAAIATPMLEVGFADAPHLKSQLQAFHPTGAIGSPADVARAVLFLLDPANSFLNGCVLPLGGGIHSRLHDPA